MTGEPENRQWKPTPKSRRCYHRVISGIERGGTLRFLTLTSSNDSPPTCQASFRALYMRLKRRGLMQGYIKVPEYTKAGRQHLHVLFRGTYIDQRLLSHFWMQIHKAGVVDIRKVRSKSPRRAIASEMAKYMAKENSLRYSWNWDWVWRGFVKDWQALKRRYHQLHDAGCVYPFWRLLRLWKHALHYGDRHILLLMPTTDIPP